MKLPQKLGPLHFIGIGGIGMSGIAEILLQLGYSIQGSDAAESANLARLREKGARVHVGHHAENLGDAEVVIVSSAIKPDNPELVAARGRRLPVARRADMLAELMRMKRCVAIAGTHGKTTTTSLVASLLEAGGLDPTVVNGGIINAYGTNARLGAGDLMVVEADESDGTFLRLPADIAIITNIDPEHLDHFKTYDAIKDAFRAFVENLPFYGFAVLCIDHPAVRELARRVEDRMVITYGEASEADARLVDLDLADGVARFGVIIRDPRKGDETSLEDLLLPMPGLHNALNATAAIVVAQRLGMGADAIRAGLKSFGGVKRRFTRTGTWKGVTIFDDYGHHPVEIAAVLRAARASAKGKVIAIMQPHRYTRLHALFDQFASCFADADMVIVADVYPAGEAPIDGADRDHLVAAVKAQGHAHALALGAPSELAGLIRASAAPGDYVVFLGAGGITQWAQALPGELAALSPEAGLAPRGGALDHDELGLNQSISISMFRS
jgi:UDP-N-acetylmuramate--alanine ligase